MVTVARFHHLHVYMSTPRLNVAPSLISEPDFAGSTLDDSIVFREAVKSE